MPGQRNPACITLPFASIAAHNFFAAQNQPHLHTLNMSKALDQYSAISGSIKVKTVFERPPAKQVNIKDLDSSKVALLKISDPFLYYSIPSVSQAAMLNQDADTTNFAREDDKSSHLSKKQKPTESEEKSCIITRKSRLSFERYHDLLHFDSSMINSAENDLIDSPFDDYLHE